MVFTFLRPRTLPPTTESTHFACDHLRFLDCPGGVPDETLEAFILSIEQLKRLVLDSHEKIYLPPHFVAEMDAHVDPMLEAAHSVILENWPKPAVIMVN